jgi:hypothetical protein
MAKILDDKYTIKRLDTYDLTNFVKTFEILSERLSNSQESFKEVRDCILERSLFYWQFDFEF